jgi:hypothetical protein
MTATLERINFDSIGAPTHYRGRMVPAKSLYDCSRAATVSLEPRENDLTALRQLRRTSKRRSIDAEIDN